MTLGDGLGDQVILMVQLFPLKYLTLKSFPFTPEGGRGLQAGVVYVNLSLGVMLEVPEGLVILTSTVVQSVPEGSTAVICVGESMTNPAGTLPNCTDVIPTKLVPVMIMFSPPIGGPELGSTDVTVGMAAM